MTSLRKTDLAYAVALRAEVDRTLAREVVDAVFDTISKSLAIGRPVVVKGFGKFEVRQRAARAGRNPHTGDPVGVPVRRAIAFVSSPSLKDVVR